MENLFPLGNFYSNAQQQFQQQPTQQVDFTTFNNDHFFEMMRNINALDENTLILTIKNYIDLIVDKTLSDDKSMGSILSNPKFVQAYYKAMRVIPMNHERRLFANKLTYEYSIIDNPDQNADTYYGNYAKIISKIKTVSPHAKIFCVGMKNNSFSSYNEAVEYMSTIFTNVYFLDMNTYCNKYEDWEDTQGHGNAMGYLNYSHQISSYVDWIIRHNRNDFKYVQFINTDKEQYIPTN